MVEAPVDLQPGVPPAVGHVPTAGVTSRRLPPVAVSRRSICSATLAFAAVALVGFDEGGYFARSWLWIALAFGATAAIGLSLAGRPAIRPLACLSLSALAALALWMLASAVWGIPGTEAAREAARACVYVAALTAFVIVGDRTSTRASLVGLLCGIVALESHALGERVVSPPAPDTFQGTLLVGPLGDANALGILAAVGVLLAPGLLWNERPNAVARGFFVVALVISASALVLTASRGALLSLLVGLPVLVVLRLRNQGGVRAKLQLRAMAVVAALAAGVWLAVSPPPLGDRPAYWRAALADTGQHPVLGSGAGTFDDFWLDNRLIAANVRDAHSLYLETLAELGPIGLALLLGALVPPLIVAVRSQNHHLVPTAAAGYSAFLVHAGLDWDWEIPATTLAGLACGAALLVSAGATGQRACDEPHTRALADENWPLSVS